MVGCTFNVTDVCCVVVWLCGVAGSIALSPPYYSKPLLNRLNPLVTGYTVADSYKRRRPTKQIEIANLLCGLRSLQLQTAQRLR